MAQATDHFGTISGRLAVFAGRRSVVLAILVTLLSWAVLWQGSAWLAARQVVATVPQGENILRLAVSGLRGELARYERLPDLMARTPVLGDALAPDAGRAQIAAATSICGT